MINDILAALINSIINGLAIDVQDLEISESVASSSSILSLFEFLKIFAIELSIIYFLLELNKKFTFEGGDVTMKTFFAPFVKFALSIAVIDNLDRIWNGIIASHNSILRMANGWENNIVSSALTDNDIHLNLIVGILFAIMLIIMWVISQVIKWVWWYKTISYKIEFMFRLGVTPIAVADCYNGLSSTAIKWIKGCLGFTIYGVAFILIPKVAFDISAGTLNNYWMHFGSNRAAFQQAFESYDIVRIYDLIRRTVDSGGELIMGFIKFLLLMFVSPIAALGSLSAVRQVIKEAVG